MSRLIKSLLVVSVTMQAMQREIVPFRGVRFANQEDDLLRTEIPVEDNNPLDMNGSDPFSKKTFSMLVAQARIDELPYVMACLSIEKNKPAGKGKAIVAKFMNYFHEKESIQSCYCDAAELLACFKATQPPTKPLTAYKVNNQAIKSLDFYTVDLKQSNAFKRFCSYEELLDPAKNQFLSSFLSTNQTRDRGLRKNHILELAMMYYYGEDGAPLNFALAWKYLNDTVKEQNNAQDVARAKGYLGEMLYHGNGVAINVEKAITLWKQIEAQTDYPRAARRAWYGLGLVYYENKGIAPNFAEALRYWQKSVEGKDINFAPLAELSIETMYYNGQGVTRDVTRAIDFWMAQIKKNDHPHLTAFSKLNLGFVYADGKNKNGEGLDQDYDKTIALWKEVAAQRESLKAAYYANLQLGTAYYQGAIVEKDVAAALQYWKIVSEQSYDRALAARARELMLLITSANTVL